MLRKILRAWLDLPLRFKGMVVVSIPLVGMLLAIAEQQILQRQQESLAQSLRRTFAAGNGVGAISNAFLAAESGARGFLLTRDDQHLAPLRQAEQDLPRMLAHLKEVVSDNPEQVARVDRARRLSDDRMEAIQAVVSDTGPQAVADRLKRAKALADPLRHELDAIRIEETRLLGTQIAADTVLRKRISMAMYGGAALSLLGGGIAMALFLAGIVRRAQLLQENANRFTHGQPLVELAPGKDEIGRLAEALQRSHMLLAEREAELRNFNQELDLRIKERTQELAKETAERRRSEEQLRQAQKMEAIGQLAGGVAHDFNNLLTVILGFGESLGERLAGRPDAQEDLNEIMLASTQAAALTRQLLAFSRRQVIDPKIVDLNTVIARTEKFLRRLIGEHIDLQAIPAVRPVSVRVDEGQIEQVLMNLVVNARDAMPNGGKLTIRSQEVDLDTDYGERHLYVVPGRYGMLSVSDTGHGMTREIQAHIFEPFFTTKQAGHGTGLGLATVYGIVKQSGGEIWVYSEPGLGTTFKIYLPIVRGTEEAAAPPAAKMSNHNPPATILLVEDEPTVRQLTGQILTRNGFTVLAADGPVTARSMSQEHPGAIELLLTDVIMPKANGRELAKELQLQHPQMKVLYMSGYTDDIISQHGVIDRGVAFLEKPFTPQALVARVRDVMSAG